MQEKLQKTGMEEAIRRAIEGGYNMERIGNPKSVIERDNALLLDPEAWRALGKALNKNGVPITIGNGTCTFTVDEEFVPELSKWSWNLQKGYIRGTLKTSRGTKRAFLHRIVIGNTLGKDEMIDHINGNRLDNRMVNLRVVNTKQNALNKKDTKNGKYRGVYENKVKKIFQTIVVFDGKKYYAGYFKDRDEAAIAVEKLRKQLFGEYHNHLNQREWWLQTWHSLIDHIASGGDVDSFFSSLLI